MPFFWDFLEGQPDGFPYDYRLRGNIPRPRFWMNTQKYDLSALVRHVVSFQWLTQQASNTGALPSNHFNLDRDGIDTTGDTPSGSDGSWASDTGGAITNDSAIDGSDDLTGTQTEPDATGEYLPAAGGNPKGAGKSLFGIKNAYMYTHNSGVNDFFVESEINVALRDYEDQIGKTHYDWQNYTDVNELFTVKCIKDGNFYKYDSSLSKAEFFSQLISYGLIQDRSYDPLIAETCWTHYPKLKKKLNRISGGFS